MFKIIVNGFFEGTALLIFLCIFLLPKIEGGIKAQIVAALGCLMFGSLLLLTNITIRRFDKKYLKQILVHPDSEKLILFTLFFSRKDCLRIRFFRFLIYLIPHKRKEKQSLVYNLRQKIMPEYSYSEVRALDKILLYTGTFLFFLAAFLMFIWHLN